MQRSELERMLKREGWVIKAGGKHNYAVHANRPGLRLTLPRGSKINDTTAHGILRDAGLR